MSELVAPAALLRDLPPLPMCARTGRPAIRIASFPIVHTPRWAYFGGLLMVLLASTRRVNLRLPIAKGVRSRQSLGAVALVLGFLLLLTAIVALPYAPRLSPVALVASAALLYYGRTYRTAWVGGTWVNETEVRLTRLDPAFAEALGRIVAHRIEAERPTTRAAWHPDPSGRHALRYFDGTQWTEHVSDAPAPPRRRDSGRRGEGP